MAEAFLVLLFMFFTLGACLIIVTLNLAIQELRRTMKESRQIKSDQI